MDTACVELKFSDGSMIAIGTIGVENETADNLIRKITMPLPLVHFHTQQHSAMAWGSTH